MSSSPEDEELERLRSAYHALGPGFPPEVSALFDREAGEERCEWRVLGSGKQRRCLSASELASDDLFALPSTWEVMRVVPRRVTRRRRGIVAVTGFLYCRPQGTWETMRVPFLHVWTLSGGRALRFQSVLDDFELRLADDAGL